MSEWKRVTLSDVSDFGIGGTPSRNIPAFWAEKPSGHPWLSIADLKGKFLSDTAEHISDLGASSSNVKLIPPGTTVMSFKLTVGRTAITTQRMYCNEAIAFFQPKHNVADGRWLYHELPRASKRVVTDTAVKGATLNKRKLAEIPLLLPPTLEQKKIAEILDTLDTQIHQTEALIAKLERIKQGLLTDLLTRGIDENGQLRPTSEQAPHLYKDSPLGWIPRKWVVSSLRDISDKITDGTHQSVNTVSSASDTVPFLYVSCIRNGKILWNKAAAIAKSDFLKISKGRCPFSGMVLYTTVGSYGHAAGISSDEPFAFQRHIACIYPSIKKIRPEFITNLLNSERMRNYADRVALGNAQKTVTLGELAAYPAPLPPLTEQDRIVAAIATLNQRMADERQVLEKLQTSKSGLMDDLLTGRVRVTPLLEAAERATA